MLGGGIEFLQLLESHRSEFLNMLFNIITMLGEEIIPVILVISLWFAYDKHKAQKLLFITAFSVGINSVIKNITKVPRPFLTGKVTCLRADTATGYSFPSGHTQSFSSWSASVAVIVKKLWFSVLVAVLIVAVAFSRMYLGAHYPGDVIVGALLGVFCAVVIGLIYDRVTNKRLLYCIVHALFLPFVIIFMVMGDRMFKDFYAFYGMLAGILPAVIFEEKYAPLRYDVTIFKKVIRIVIAVAVAGGVKAVFSVFGSELPVRVVFLLEVLEYGVLVFSVFGLCPYLFKRIKNINVQTKAGEFFSALLLLFVLNLLCTTIKE